MASHKGGRPFERDLDIGVAIDFEAANADLKGIALGPKRRESLDEFRARLRPIVLERWTRLQPPAPGEDHLAPEVSAQTPLSPDHLRFIEGGPIAPPGRGRGQERASLRFLTLDEWRRPPRCLEEFFTGPPQDRLTVPGEEQLPLPTGGWRIEPPDDSELDRWLERLFGEAESRRKVLASLFVGHRWGLSPDAAYRKAAVARRTLRDMEWLDLPSQGGRPKPTPTIPAADYVAIAVKKLGLVRRSEEPRC